jgi:hypothetical protein
MSNTTEVVIFFVGLALWSNQVPNHSGVHVIFPQVRHSGMATEQMAAPPLANNANRMSPEVQSGIGIRAVPHVEEHRAAIISYTNSFVPIQGSSWTPSPLGTETDPTFSYVPLSGGEHVRFIATGASPDRLTINQPGLPHLKPGTQLNTGDPYAGAAVVFDLPEMGTMNSCLSRTRAEKARLDTRLVLAGDLTVIVSDTHGTITKQFQITPHDGKILLVAANIPKRTLVDGDYNEYPPNLLDRMPHVNAFYAMTNSTCGDCTEKLKQWFLDHMEEVEPCQWEITRTAGKWAGSSPDCSFKPPSENTLAGVVQGANFMCSNEGWP